VRCQDGDQGAYDELFSTLHQDAFRWIYSLVRNEEDALEIMQDCFVRVFRHLPRLQDPSKFPSWFSRMIVNQVNTWRVKAAKTRTEHLEESWEVPNDSLPIQGSAGSGSPRTMAARTEVLEHVNEAIAHLPPKQRTAVMLFDVEGWTIKKIAESLDCSEGAVKFNIFQGRRKLRSLLGQYVDEEGNARFDEVE